MIENIRTLSKTEEFDSQFLMNCLKDYKSPRDRVTTLFASGALVRVRRGLYVFGKNWSRRPYSLETLANMIYGPSYVSMEYALQYYGMIPEHVHEVTSVTIQRSKQFETPIGRFSYFYLSQPRYAIGFNWVSFSHYHGALIASKEKAVADLLFKKKYRWVTDQDIEDTLFEDLRLERESVLQLNRSQVYQIAAAYRNRTITHFNDWLQRNS